MVFQVPKNTFRENNLNPDEFLNITLLEIYLSVIFYYLIIFQYCISIISEK